MKFKFFSKILAFSVLFSAILSTSTSNAIKFGDMQGYAWAEKFVEDTSEKGLISGYPDGTFKPGSPVTRIESLIMISNLYSKSEIDITYKNNISKYNDRLDRAKIEDWAKPYVVFALEKKIIPNRDEMIAALVDSSSKKSITAKRFEVCVFLVRGLGLEGEINKSATLSYKDNDSIIKDAIPYVELLQRKGVLSKEGDGTGFFKPNNSVTRAETAVMLSNAYKYSQKASIDNNPTQPTQPKAPETLEVQNVSGSINLITLTNDDVSISLTTDDNKIQNYSAKKNELAIKVGGAITSINDLKVGQKVTLTLNKGKLIQITADAEEKRISGKIVSFTTSEPTTITIKSNNEDKVLRYNKDTQIYVNDVLTPISKLPLETDIDAYYTDNLIVKAAITHKKSELRGEITDYTNNSITIKDKDLGVVRKDFADDIKIYRNDKRVSVSDIAVGDIATIKTDAEKITDVSIEAKSEKYKSAYIKSIQLNSDYNKIVIVDNSNNERTLTINNNAIIRIGDKRTNIYSLKVGHSVEVYATGGMVEEIISSGEFKQTTVNGKVVSVDVVDKYIEIRQNDGKNIKMYYNNNTKIEQLSNGTVIDAKKILSDDTVTGIGILEGGNINVTRVIVNI